MTRAAVALACAVVCSACGLTAQQAARHTLAVTATAVHATDAVLAPRYEAEAARTREAVDSWAAYDAAMAPWNAAEEAERATVAALLSTEALVDAWGLAGESFLRAAPCLVSAVDELFVALEAVHIEVEPLRLAVGALSQYAGECHGAD